MNLYFANRSFDILGMASTVQGAEWPIINDVLKEDIDTSIETLEFDIFYKNATDRPKAKYLTKEGNYILYHGDYGDTCFTIIEMESDPVQKTIHVLAEDAGLDLINEIAPQFTPPQTAQTIRYYTDRFLSDDFQVGLNEIPARTRTLGWDSETTMTERLESLASQFDCEIKFRFQIVEMTLISKWLDIYDRRGKDVAQELRLGREIENIVEKRSVANLATALHPTGAATEINGESGPPLTLNGYSYDDGDFYVDGETLKSRKAVAAWGRYNASKGYASDHTVKTYSYETTSKVTLCNQAIARLKKLREPEVTYDVSLFYIPSNLNIGDRVNLVDDKGELYLSARMLSIEISETNDYRHAMFGDFIVKTSGISDRLIEIANKLREEAANAVKYEWIVYADDAEGHGISLSPEGKTYIGIAANKVTETPDLEHPLLYNWSKIKGEDGEPGQNGTSLIDYNVYYKLSRSSNHPDNIRKITEDGKRVITESDTIVDDLIDSEGNEIVDSNGNLISGYIHYVSRIIEGNFAWSTEIPEALPGYFLWTKTVSLYSNGEEYIAYSVAASGRGVASTKTEYYQSESAIEPTGGEWSEEIQEFDEDKTYFSRVETTYTDGTVTVSQPKLDAHLNVTVETKAMAERTDKHFFVNTDGVHVTVGENTPNHGKNVRVTNEALEIREDTTTLASFGADLLRMGKTDSARVDIQPNATTFYGATGAQVGKIANSTTYYSVSGESIFEEGGDRASVISDYSNTTQTHTLSYTPVKNPNVSDRMLRVQFILENEGGAVYDQSVYFDAAGSASFSSLPATVTYSGRNISVALGNLATVIPSSWEGAFIILRAYYYRAEDTSNYTLGMSSSATGKFSYAGGYGTTATGEYSHAHGRGLYTNEPDITVVGRYNRYANAYEDNVLFAVGNGSSSSSRSDAFQVTADGFATTSKGPLMTLNDIFGPVTANLPENYNLNNAVDPGHYFCSAREIAQTQTNYPFNNSAYQMLVFKFGSGYMRMQVAWQNSTSSYIKYRMRNSNGTWGSWYFIDRNTDTAELLTKNAADLRYVNHINFDETGTIEYQTAGSSTRAIPAGSTYTNICRIQCGPGKWAVTARAGFQNSTGAPGTYKNVAIGTSTTNSTYGFMQVPTVSAGNTTLQTTRYITLSDWTYLYLNVFSAVACNLSESQTLIEAICIKGSGTW